MVRAGLILFSRSMPCAIEARRKANGRNHCARLTQDNSISTLLSTNQGTFIGGFDVSMLARFLEALPAAATSSYAYLSYTLTIAAWLVVAWRTQRGKQLLAHLEKFPEKERAKLLRDEMGMITVREGLSPEQWLRSRIHFYYLVGFLALCTAIVIVIVVALTQQGEPHKEAASSASGPTQPAPVPPVPAETEPWQHARVGVQRSYVEAHLGPAQLEEPINSFMQTTYALDRFYLQVVYSAEKRVVQVAVTSRDKTFHPIIPDWPVGELKLGDFRFSDLADYTTPYAFDFSSKDWYYVEGMGGFGATNDRSIFLSYSDYGADYCPSAVTEGTAEALQAATGFEGVELTEERRNRWQFYRSLTCPNSFAIRAPIDSDEEDSLPLPVIYREIIYELGV